MNTNKKPEISYPCNWNYKVIGTDIIAIKAALNSIITSVSLVITESHESRTGKYCSVNANVVVSNEQERLMFYEKLGNHTDIKLVL